MASSKAELRVQIRRIQRAMMLLLWIISTNLPMRARNQHLKKKQALLQLHLVIKPMSSVLLWRILLWLTSKSRMQTKIFKKVQQQMEASRNEMD
jgi:hypothetical protein